MRGFTATACSGLVAISLVAGHIAAIAQTADIDFGTDASEFARDGECDDARFQGDGMSEVILTDEIGRDASDCRAAMASGRVAINPLYAEPASDAAIIWGDDASEYAKDGECDDIRFAHSGSAATVYLAEDVGHDATDCKAGFEAGTLTWQGHRADMERGVTADDIETQLSPASLTVT